jgi:hypothetical protein
VNAFVVPSVKLPELNILCPPIFFVGSKPNISFDAFVLPFTISFSSARGSKSESESELRRFNPSSLVPIVGFSASIGFVIEFLGGTIGANVFFGDVSINN